MLVRQTAPPASGERHLFNAHLTSFDWRPRAFVVGKPKMAGRAPESLRNPTTRRLDDFARFCDEENRN
jgi:hypothetical protein